MCHRRSAQHFFNYIFIYLSGVVARVEVKGQFVGVCSLHNAGLVDQLRLSSLGSLLTESSPGPVPEAKNLDSDLSYLQSKPVTSRTKSPGVLLLLLLLLLREGLVL